MIKAIFFDFDGTISDARFIAIKSLERVLEEEGYDFDKRELKKHMGEKMSVLLKNLGLKSDNIWRIRKRFYRYFRRAASEGGIKLCVSVNPLYGLKKERIPLIIVSNSETSFLKTSIKRLKIKGLFKKIYGAEKFNTKDEMLEKLFRRYGIRPCEAIYVGDRFSDIDYARRAGCYAVAIYNKCSWSSLGKLKKERPDYIIKDFVGLKRIVHHLNKDLE